MKWQETWARAGAGFSERLAEAVMARPIVSIVASLLLTVIAGLGLAGYHYSKDHRVFFDAHNPLLVGFEKLQEDYSRTDTVLVAVAPKNGNVFDPVFLAALQELTAKSWKVPYVQRVESLTNFQRVQVEGDSIATGDMVPANAALDAKALADIRQASLNEPFLVDALVNKQGSVTALRLTLNLPNKDPVTEVPAVVNALRALADEVRAAQPGTTVHLAGQTIANQAFPE
ncbi:MAG: putative exporter of the superfamily, partial [Moraxellaceae bacterium]|nr:putative exporter of the superfamily [Moraxellaceae bacterium]